MNKLDSPKLPDTNQPNYRLQFRFRLNDILKRLVLNNNQAVDGRLFTGTTPTSFPYTFNQNDQLVFVDQSASSQAVILRSAADDETKRVVIKSTGLSSNQIEISALSGNVEGKASFTISGTFAVAEFASDGTNWWRL